jgi:hypothetical protein
MLNLVVDEGTAELDIDSELLLFFASGRVTNCWIATGGGRALVKEMRILFLGLVPLDPRIGMACDYRESFFDSYADSPAYKALKGVVRELADQLKIAHEQVMLDEP